MAQSLRDEGIGPFSRERTRPAAVFAEGWGNKEWVVGEGSNKYQIKSRDETQK